MDYQIEKSSFYRVNADGDRELMSNFTAKITEEVRYVDGINSKTMLTITGEIQGESDDSDPIELPAVKVSTDEFPNMGWVVPAWGVKCVIRPGGSIKDDLRTAIQLWSDPKVTTVYRNMGWTTDGIAKKGMYLHAGGGITGSGNNASIQVMLPQELSLYNLATNVDPKIAFAESLNLAAMCPPEIGWSLLAATMTPLYGPCDFAIHLAGRTGTFKSEVMSLFQSHFGPGMDARHLPGSWSSTANALEAQAFYAKNAPFVVDDFVPTGTSWQQRAYQQTADKIIRAQGNQAGRARLTDVSSLQQTMYPRGIILSTGEDVPEGHSVRARMLILELTPGDIDANLLTERQRNRPNYVGGTAAFIRMLAKENQDITDEVTEERNLYLNVGHTRTPSMLARLTVTIRKWLIWGGDIGAISKKQRDMYIKQASEAIAAAGNKQQGYLEDADPVDIFYATIRQVLAAGLGHLRTRNGGIPLKAEILGWTRENSLGEMPTFKSRGPCIGWIDWAEDELYIDITVGYNVIKKVSGNELTLTKQTMIKRLKDAGTLARTDDARQRNTVRITAEGHPRQVIALSASATLEVQEKPGDSYEN